MKLITKRIRVGIGLALLIESPSCSCTQESSGIDQIKLPNIILLMGDDHGWDEVGYNGHPFVKTPVLDEMASNGLRFERFYAAHPTSSPTRASFLTGRHPNRYGTFAPGWSIRPEEITIADILGSAGYSSAHFGKWHVGPVKKESPTNPGAMGFNEWLSHDNFFEMNPVLSRNGDTPKMIEGEGSMVIIEEAIKFIEKSKNNKQPFLTVIWFGSPHEPYSGLPEDLALYENLPDSLANQKVKLTSNKTGKQVTRELREVLQGRYAEITAMDRAIGKLRSYLDENNLKNNTIIFYCGDNGPPLEAGRTGITFRGQKGSLYEGGIRVPAVLEWPAVIKQPISTSILSTTSDLVPTFAELVDQPLPERELDGVSLIPLFQKPTSNRNTPLFFWQFEYKRILNNNPTPYIDPVLQKGTTPLVKISAGKSTRDFHNYTYTHFSENDFTGERSIIKNQYKLIVEGNYPNEHGFELYNIQTDPGEKENIADKHPGIMQELNTELHEWQESVLKSLTAADYKQRTLNNKPDE